MRNTRGVLIVSGTAFAALVVAAVFISTDGIDTTVRDAILRAASPEVIALMRVINVAGEWPFLLPATLAILAIFDRARRTWWLWIALMVAAPLAEGAMKIAVGRPRPEGSAYGFPSGHATAAAAYFGALLYLSSPLPSRRRVAVRILSISAIVAVAIARIMLRAHWPSDVLGGIALGLTLASAAALLASRTTPS